LQKKLERAEAKLTRSVNGFEPGAQRQCGMERLRTSLTMG
jgi:hypothetical protein